MKYIKNIVPGTKCRNLMHKLQEHDAHAKCTNVMLKMHPQIAKTLCTKNPDLWYLHTVVMLTFVASEGANYNCYWDHASMMAHPHFEHKATTNWIIVSRPG